MTWELNLSEYNKNKLNENALKIIAEQEFSDQSITSISAYNSKVTALRQIMKKEAESADEYYVYISALRGQCRKIIDSNDLDVVLPHLPQRFIEDPGFRSRKHFDMGQDFYLWLDSYKAMMVGDRIKEMNDPEVILACLNFSLITLNGVYDKKKIRAINNGLISNNVGLKSYNKRPYLEIELETSSGEYTHEKDGIYYTRVRHFLEPVSLGVLHKFLALDQTNLPRNITAQSLFRLMKKHIHDFQHSAIKTLSDFIDGAIYVSGTNDIKLFMSEMLYSTQRGDIITYPCDENSLKRVFGFTDNNRDSVININTREEQIEPEELASISDGEINYKNLPIIKDYYKDLVGILADYCKDNNSNKFILNIEKTNIKHSNLSSVILVLADYLSDLSRKKNKLKATTIRNYFYYLSGLWYPEMVYRDQNNLSTVDLCSAYENMVHRLEGDNSINRKLSLLKNVHNFASRKYPDIFPNSLELGMLDEFKIKAPTRVRTEIITHRELKAATLDVVNGPSITRDQAMVCRIMYIAFRTGMRKGEILKVRLKDIDPSGLWWVKVVNNPFGKNKSKASARSIPLKLLLHADEFKDFEAFYWSRADDVAPNHLLFGLGSLNFRLSDNFVTSFAQMLLRQVSGDSKIVFHSLRHSAANAFHAIIEDEQDFAMALTGFDKVKIKEIREEIVGPEFIKLTRYWELANLMGHSSPAMTFNSYLHLTDMIVNNKILRTKRVIQTSGLLELTYGDSSQNLENISHTKQSESRLKDKRKIIVYMLNKNKDLYEHHAEKRSIDKVYSNEYLHEGLRKNVSSDFLEIRNRLINYQNGMSINEILDKFGFAPQLLQGFITNAHSVFNDYRTEKNNPRFLCEGDRLGIPIDQQVVPRLPQRISCQHDANGALNSIINSALKSETARAKALDFLELILNNGYQDKPYLKIRDPKGIKELTNSFNKSFFQKRWYMKVFLQDIDPQNPKRKKWERVFPKKGILEFLKKDAADRGYGTAYLYYQVKGFKEQLTLDTRKSKGIKHIGSDQLRYIAQMLKIVLG